jgi:hypothetical protein
VLIMNKLNVKYFFYLNLFVESIFKNYYLFHTIVQLANHKFQIIYTVYKYVTNFHEDIEIFFPNLSSKSSFQD